MLERTFTAPPRVLFRAYAEPEHLRRWFGPPGYPLTLCEVDFRVGGRFRFAMTGPDGVQNPPFGGEYLVIEPDRRLSFSNGFEAEGSGVMIVTVTLSLRDGRTHLHQRAVFETVEMKDEHVNAGFHRGSNAAFGLLEDLTRELS